MPAELSYLGREGARYRFAVGDQAAREGAAGCLSRLGVSKTLSGRLRAQGRASLDAGAQILEISCSQEACQPQGAQAGPSSPTAAQPLYEDDFIFALDKPAGVLVHGDGTGQATLTDAACTYIASHEALLAPQAVQRLDVPTTGVVLFSKAVEFQGSFDALVADHALMTKRYLAVVAGAYPRSHDRIAAELARDRHDARKMRVCAAGAGQAALTEVERLAVSPDRGASLLLVTLRTGRKHQIRVHLASKGFPIMGDALYGAPTSAAKGPLMLHAWREEFTHPITGEQVSITSPSTERFAAMFPGLDGLLAV